MKYFQLLITSFILILSPLSAHAQRSSLGTASPFGPAPAKVVAEAPGCVLRGYERSFPDFWSRDILLPAYLNFREPRDPLIRMSNNKGVYAYTTLENVGTADCTYANMNMSLAGVKFLSDPVYGNLIKCSVWDSSLQLVTECNGITDDNVNGYFNAFVHSRTIKPGQFLQIKLHTYIDHLNSSRFYPAYQYFSNISIAFNPDETIIEYRDNRQLYDIDGR